MNWNEAIELYYDYLATHLVDTDKTAIEKAVSRKNIVADLLSSMPSLRDKCIEDLTPEIWIEALRSYKESDRFHRTWADLRNWPRYQALRACVIFARDGYTCKYCGPEESMVKIFNVDHIVPISKQGSEELTNLQCVCHRCNKAKFDMPEEEFLQWIREIKSR
ncbi:MAG: HNH endonuclease [Methanomassiliicoccales archaeon]|nr:MAG: HNH endonuclease [Methanomassiliicoccales archaeon]